MSKLLNLYLSFSVPFIWAWAMLFTVILFVGIFVSHTSKIKQKQNEQLRSVLHDLLDEKESLVTELHHRVKNNLHVVLSLINSQAFYASDEALAALKKSQHRIYTISLLYQKYYLTGEKNNVDMSKYIPDLLGYLQDSFKADFILFELQVGDISLELSKAVSIGLIINEAITNSIKHAFPSHEDCRIGIKLVRLTSKIRLTVYDNGIGMQLPEGHQMHTLGVNLLSGLSEEVEGKLEIRNEMGTEIELTFPA